MGVIVGIDLGTTFSVVAQLDEMGLAKIIYNPEGDNLTPSVVEINKDKSVEVGQLAKHNLGIEDKVVLDRFKRHIGTGKVYETKYGDFTPKDLSCLVLKKLKDEAEKVIGEIDEAVVTIPANFSNNAREETLSAAKEAGLNISNIINEPTAAAMYFANTSGDSLSGHYCVFDLGGGTFDVSIVKIHNNDIEVISTEGVAQLGGTDFDNKLVNLIKEKYNSDTTNASTNIDFTINDAEELKKYLSKKDDWIIPVYGDGGKKNIKIERKVFEEIISSYFVQIEMLCEEALDNSGLEKEEINKIILVGGSTRIPAIHKIIAKIFGKQPVSYKNPDEVVALGAALYAGYKAVGSNLNEIQKSKINQIKVQDITTACYGIICDLFNSKKDSWEAGNSSIIKKGEKLPVSATEEYFTKSEGQEAVACKITETKEETTDERFVKIIWEGYLELPPNRPRGQKILVTFSYNENQIMSCSFVDEDTNRKTEVDIKISNEDASSDFNLDEFTIE